MILFYSTFSINRNNGKRNYQHYIKNSIQIKIYIEAYKKGNVMLIDFRPGHYLTSYSQSGSNKGTMDKMIFYDKGKKKYFVIT